LLNFFSSLTPKTNNAIVCPFETFHDGPFFMSKAWRLYLEWDTVRCSALESSSLPSSIRLARINDSVSNKGNIVVQHY